MSPIRRDIHNFILMRLLWACDLVIFVAIESTKPLMIILYFKNNGPHSNVTLYWQHCFFTSDPARPVITTKLYRPGRAARVQVYNVFGTVRLQIGGLGKLVSFPLCDFFLTSQVQQIWPADQAVASVANFETINLNIFANICQRERYDINFHRAIKSDS